MRLIDADKLMSDIEHYHLSDGKFQHWVEIQPTIEPEPHWIPCSERLPEEDGRYLVTLENGHEKILNYATTQTIRYPQGFYYITEDGFAWRQTQNLVTAWMPLPDPYQPKESES